MVLYHQISLEVSRTLSHDPSLGEISVGFQCWRGKLPGTGGIKPLLTEPGNMLAATSLSLVLTHLDPVSHVNYGSHPHGCGSRRSAPHQAGRYRVGGLSLHALARSKYRSGFNGQLMGTKME